MKDSNVFNKLLKVISEDEKFSDRVEWNDRSVERIREGIRIWSKRAHQRMAVFCSSAIYLFFAYCCF